jgi:hypothetical protein
MLEHDVLRQCRGYLRATGWYVIRNHQSMGSHRGLSDLTIIKGGRVIFLEIKATGGTLSDYQIKFCEDIRVQGANYMWVNSLDELMQYLEGKKLPPDVKEI